MLVQLISVSFFLLWYHLSPTHLSVPLITVKCAADSQPEQVNPEANPWSFKDKQTNKQKKQAFVSRLELIRYLVGHRTIFTGLWGSKNGACLTWELPADSYQAGKASLLGECVSVCLHKRGSAGFPGSGNIQYVNTASCSTSGAKDRPQMEESAVTGWMSAICRQITAALTSSGCERITEECDVDL